MSETILSFASELLQIAVLLAALILCFRWARRAEDKLWLVFFALAMAAYLLSDLYWFAHGILRDGARIPFAANDVADFGFNLLLASALRLALGRRRLSVWIAVAAGLFTAANIVLWLAWSGEWVRDILGGLPWAYLFITAACSLRLARVLRPVEWIALALLAAALIAAEACGILMPDYVTLLETAGYGIAFAVEAWVLLRSLFALCRPGTAMPKHLPPGEIDWQALSPQRQRADATLSLCVFGFCWTSVSLYLSSGVPYDVFNQLNTLYFFLMLLAARRRVRAA